MTHPLTEIRTLGGEGDLIDADLCDLYARWNESRGGALGSTSLDLIEFPQVLERCMTVDVRMGKPCKEAVIKFAGSFLVRNAGLELTGLPLSSLEPYPYISRLIGTCSDMRQAVFTNPHQVAYDPRRHLVVQEICLPLSRDGQIISEMVFAFSIVEHLPRSSLWREYIYRPNLSLFFLGYLD